MKTIKHSIKTMMLAIALFAASFNASAQNQTKPTAAVLGIDSKGVIQDAASVGYMVRLELEKTNLYNVMDKYDVAEAVKKNGIDVATCFGKSCVVNAGKSLGVDKMVTGSIERFGEKIVISLKVIDVKSELTEKQDATEYLNLQPELQKMIRISVQKLLGIPTDENVVNLLINYDTPIESPKTQINLNGPRMGGAFVFGDDAAILQEPSKDKGGFDMYPVMFQFGWQKEWQYLSAGNFQALVEFIPIVTGLESGKFIPSVNFMNGFRFGKGGWEVAFGPSFRVVKKAEGFYDTQGYFGTAGEWHLSNDWQQSNLVDTGMSIVSLNPYALEKRIDSRGVNTLSTRLVIGFGRTFKSGYLNMPVNVYIAPAKHGTFVGFSFGFNIYKKPRVQ